MAGTWKPSLGLDLQGGLRITLTALDNPSEESLEEARRIIDQRVNGSGVVEAEVTAQSGEFIVVEIPGSTENRRQMEELVKRQAQLRFRLVACSDQAPGPCATGGGNVPMGRAPLDLRSTATEEPTGSETPDGNADQPTDGPSGQPTDQPTDGPATDSTVVVPPEGEDAEGGQGGVRTAEDELQWINSPDPQSVQLFNELQCTPRRHPRPPHPGRRHRAGRHRGRPRPAAGRLRGP
ncbi:hypothetical protein [Nocardioides sp. TF02-7]|uniref:hypothetical protein n=1 Tax=Nocardioides sp. TF02-7 TaxID=2917724 RepID=UPI001F065E97|nr:hypothetical protein [Nocardioides sp. TF02-7]UMG92651.1 hypothetical protein MF408_23330 [Nocardioides sp. TF02-7]